ncbi:Mitochondrial coenzyme A transporter SLC25A42 [Halotydeus destructor]|nr:Mitochondrial coenzyme A transporter SLC25A42 [Halotydeus destructor]
MAAKEIVEEEGQSHVNDSKRSSGSTGSNEKRKLNNVDYVVTSLLSGALAGAVAKTVIAPLDRTKINFQIQKKKFSFHEAYKFLLESYKKNGLYSLWRGNTATLARVMPFAAINYAAHEQFKRILEAETNAQKKKNPARSFVAGSLSGVVSTTLTYPLDLARARMAVTGSSEYRSVRSVFVKTISHEGYRALYRGYLPTVLGSIPYSGTGFFAYETLKRFHYEYIGADEPSHLEKFLFGAIAGAAGQTASYPLDIVRRRMQTRSKEYHTIIGTLRYVLVREGIKGGLYKGLSMNWIKGPIAVGTSFLIFDLMTTFLRGLPYFTET